DGGFKAILDQPTADQPGGAHGTTPPPVFNVGFRFDEPAVNGDLDGMVADPLGSAGTRTVGAGHWREHAQALALAARDITLMHADIDFAKIAAGTDDFSGVPRTGFISRLYSSRLNLGEGAKPERPMLLSPVQPYGVYVPASYDGSTPAPLTLALHSLSCSYNQYAVFAPRLYQELGEERGAIVLTTEGRGPDGWYHDEAEYDLFEAWNDLAHRYAIDASRVTINGYSMGGYATWKIGSQYPDLFASGFAIVGPAGENIAHAPTNGEVADPQGAIGILDNLRNVPVLAWHGTNDELVPVAGAVNVANRLRDLGYRHEVDFFPGYDHFLFSVLDRWGPGKAWLNAYPVVNRDPDHITYRVRPQMDNAALGLIHDHAYWLDDIRVAGDAPTGLVDAVSEARGNADPTLSPIIPPVGTEPAPHVKSGLGEYGPGAGPQANKIRLRLDAVSALTVWLNRAGIDTTAPFTIEVATNAPVVVTLAGSNGTSTHPCSTDCVISMP
ncbi:MAG: prolyl oligopeptidase family serine peptidase, partial [Actinomycetota bacterium]